MQVLKQITRSHLLVLKTNPNADWKGLSAEEESELPNLETELNVGGIYLRLLAANPGWILRKPKEILGQLIEAALQLLAKEPVSANDFINVFKIIFKPVLHQIFKTIP